MLIETIQSALNARPACRVETNSPATVLEGPLPSPGPRWRVRTADGRVFEADTLVSTLEGPALARLLGDRLARSRAALAAMKTSPVTVVAFPRRAPAGSILTTSFLGGALDPALAAAPDSEVLAVGAEEAKRLHPGLATPARSWIFRWPAAIPQIPLLHHRTLAAVEEDLGNLPGLVLTGGWRDGIAMGERIARGEALGATL